MTTRGVSSLQMTLPDGSYIRMCERLDRSRLTDVVTLVGTRLLYGAARDGGGWVDRVRVAWPARFPTA